MVLTNYIGKQVNILEGNFAGETGTFIRDISYTGWSGLLCAIDVYGETEYMPANYFVFDDYNIQMCFENEECNKIFFG